MSEIKAVIFDFFDVVHGDPQKAWLKEYGFEREGIFAEASDRLDLGLIDANEYYERYAWGHGHKTADQVRAEFKELAKIDLETVAIVKKLRSAKYLTGLLSNTSPDEITPILEEHELRPIFNEIIISGEVGLKKPDPAIFEMMLKRLEVKPSEAIFVDDTLDNVEAAMAVGMVGIQHTDAAHLKQQLTLAGIQLN